MLKVVDCALNCNQPFLLHMFQESTNNMMGIIKTNNEGMNINHNHTVCLTLIQWCVCICPVIRLHCCSKRMYSRLWAEVPTSHTPQHNTLFTLCPKLNFLHQCTALKATHGGLGEAPSPTIMTELSVGGGQLEEELFNDQDGFLHKSVAKVTLVVFCFIKGKSLSTLITHLSVRPWLTNRRQCCVAVVLPKAELCLGQNNSPYQQVVLVCICH